MFSPFPGMNPYLEHSAFWPGVHLLLIAALSDFLSPQLRPKYRVAVEVRIYNTIGESLLVGIPDVTVKRSVNQSHKSESNVIKQGYLEVREVGTQEVVTVIEVLSPVNKRSGEGRKIYENKRTKIIGSFTHLIEIDLLRNWEPMPIIGDNIESDYRILVSRGDCCPKADLYIFNLKDQIPSFPLPLKAGDVEPIIDLKSLLEAVYERGGYDLDIDYSQNPIPPLSKEKIVWIDNLLKEKGFR